MACGTARDTACGTASACCGTVGGGLRNGASAHHDTVPSARPEFRVCTLCTRPSFDSVHCSESLFESLFMNTIHEVLKKIIIIK